MSGVSDELKLNSSQTIDKMYSYFNDINDLNINWIYEVENFNMTMSINNNNNTLANTINSGEMISVPYRCNTDT